MQIFSGYNHKKVSNIKNILEHVRKDCSESKLSGKNVYYNFQVIKIESTNKNSLILDYNKIFKIRGDKFPWIASIFLLCGDIS